MCIDDWVSTVFTIPSLILRWLCKGSCKTMLPSPLGSSVLDVLFALWCVYVDLCWLCRCRSVLSDRGSVKYPYSVNKVILCLGWFLDTVDLWSFGMFWYFEVCLQSWHYLRHATMSCNSCKRTVVWILLHRKMYERQFSAYIFLVPGSSKRPKHSYLICMLD